MREQSTVAVLMFDGAPLFETSVPVSVFGVDRTASGAPAFTLLPVAAQNRPLTSTAGLQVHAPFGLDALDRAGIIVVPSWRDPLEPPPRPVVDALRAAHADGALIVGLCLGAFVLAAAGLLDGRRAATHWFHAPALAARYPRTQVDPTVLFVDAGEVITSAGTAAGLDACLHVVRRIWGARAAAAIARRMVVAPQRPGGQAQFMEQPVPDVATGADVAEVMTHVLTHLADPLDVDALARRAHLSRRTFDRRFRAATGTSPLQWLQHQRILHARRLLEDTDLPVDAIARQVGLASAVSLRPLFHRSTGVSPLRYREAFRAVG